MDVDYINWLCDNSEGFEWFASTDSGYEYLNISDTYGRGHLIEEFDNGVDIVEYKLLIHSAFWGCKKFKSLHMSNYGEFCFQLYNHPMNIRNCFPTVIECMEKGMEYVYEQGENES